jgi:putative RecB family exonuclease
MIAQIDSPAKPSPQQRIKELQKSVSASRLNCWQTCRLKFFFRYVLQIKKAKPAALFMGSMFHSVMQAWNLARWREGRVDAAKLKQQLDQDWQSEQSKEPVRWEEQEEPQSKQETWSMFETYLQHTPIALDEKPEAVEVSTEADLSHHGLPKLVGVIDLVRQGGRIVDFKTSSTTPNPEKVEHLHETQLSSYAVLYRDAVGRKEGGLELHHLVKLKTPKLVVNSFPPMTQNQEARLFRIMESYLNGLDNEDFIPSPSPMSCSCCEYFNECRRWS